MDNYSIVTYQASKFEFLINYNIEIYRQFYQTFTKLENSNIDVSMFLLTSTYGNKTLASLVFN